MNKRFLSILAIAAIGLLTIVNSLVLVRANVGAAQLSAPSIPQRISYQGRLMDADGNPLDGTYSMTFRLWDHPTAGTLCWTESQDVTVDYGVFTVLLGDITPIESVCFSGPDLYLGVEVGSDGEMTPRRQVVSVGYAYRAEEVLRANDADTVDGLHASDFARVGQEVPSGAIILWDGSSCPSGWTRVAELDGKFLVGGSSYNPSAGGSNTVTPSGSVSVGSHSHTVPATQQV